MAATLPPINSGNGGKKVPPYAESRPQTPTSGRLKPLQKGASKREREMHEKRIKLRQLQRDLTKAETSVYRNTYRHTLCLDMLKEGFHLSFRELFTLIHQQLDERQRQGPESFMWTQVMLENEHEKLDILKRHLMKAETAQRSENFLEVYECRYELANYFISTGDKWLSDHFFQTCLEIAEGVVDDGGKIKALGQCNVGRSLEEKGDIMAAAEHFELYYDLSKEHREDWLKMNDEGQELSFYADACINLYHIYTAIGNRLEEIDPEKSLEYLTKALDKTKESHDVMCQGEAAYRLGLAFEKSGNTAVALKHLNNFYHACQELQDFEGMGRACDAIAKAYARQGNKEQSINYLKQFVQNAEDNGMDKELSLACHNLGNILNSLGSYKEAGEYFNRAYNISRAVGENQSIQVNRVQSGIAQAHSMLRPFSAHIVRGDSVCLTRILEWKSVRQSYFSEPLPEPKPMTPPQPVLFIVPPPEPTPANEENKNENAGDENKEETHENVSAAEETAAVEEDVTAAEEDASTNADAEAEPATVKGE